MKTTSTSFTNFFQGGRLSPFARVAFCTTFLLVFATPARAVESQVLQGRLPTAVSRLQPVERLAGDRRLSLAIGLPLRNQSGLTTLLQQLTDPASPNYRQWLTPEQFTESFGPTEADYHAVADWAQANGLTVTTRYPNRLVLDVAGAAADIENALHVQFQVYQHPSEARKFFAPNSAPSLDLSVPLASISGLDDYSLPRPMLRVDSLDQTANATPRSGSGPGGAYAGGDFRAAYVPGTLLTGAGQIVGLLQFDGYYASDVAAYRTQFGLPNIPLVNVPVDGGVIIPGDGNVEVCLDIEMVMSMAPGVTAIYVFEAPNPSPWDDLLNTMVANTAIRQFSCSWGGGSRTTTAEAIFQQMAAQGQSCFNASGDYDAFCGSIAFPAESANITQVGGTTLTTAVAGGGYVSETVWNWGLHKGSYIGSGGGVSPTYAIPSWQQGISMGANNGSTTMRNIPDVALTADNVYVTYGNGSSGIFGGTSCAAPLWAGFTALVNQHAVDSSLPTIGFMNPPVYNICKDGLYASTFHDTTTGNNTNSTCGPTRFPAVPGYDLATGWGTPTTALINALLASFEPLQISPATGFSSSGRVGGPFTASSIGLTLTNGGTNSLTWSLVNTSVWLNASPGGSTLAPGGPAATVTVSLNSGASNLALGTYTATVWFSNLNDNLGLGREFDLAVISPPTIVVQPTNQTVSDGTIATFTVGVNGGQPLSYQWQANSNNLTDGGHIFGSATATLSISNVAPANAVSYRVIVTNAAGIAVSSNALLVALPGNADHFAWGAIPSPQVFGKPFAANLTALDRAHVISTNFNGSLNLTAWASSAGNQSIEDFESGVWPHAPWVLAPGSGTVVGTLSTNYAHDGFYGLSDPAWTYRTDVQLGTAGDALSWWIRPGSSSSGRAYLGFAASSSGCWSVVAAPDTSQLIIELNDGFSDDQGMAVVSQTWQAAKWYKVAVQFSSGSAITCNLYDEDGATLLNTLTYSGVTDLPGGVAMKSFGQFSIDTLQTGAGPMPIPITPALAASFVSGLWSGTITTLRVATNVLLNASDSAGHLGVSNPFSVIFSNQPPLLTAQPTHQSVPSGYDVTFTLGADGSPPLSYMWLLNGTAILGATHASYTTNNVPLSASGSQFSCMVSNAYGTTNSQVATLTVLALPPTITQQPVNLTVTEGRGATFSVTATGSLPLSYYWLLNETPILGATNASFTTNIVPLSASGSEFSCLVSNGYGTVLSSNAILTVVVAPPDWFTELFGTVTTNLAHKTFTFTPNGSANSYTVCSLPNLAFPTDPAGGTPLILTDDGYSPIALSGGKTVAIYSNQSSVIYVGSNGYLTMKAGDASLWPSYTSHFSLPRVSALYCDLNPNAGGTVSWKQLDDRAAVTYQAVPVYHSNTQTNSFQVELFFDGRIRITYLDLNASIGLVGLSAGAGQPTNFVASDFAGYHSCELQPPSISSQPTNQTVPPGSSATFTVGAWGSPPLSYSWLLNGTPMPGATTASFTTNNVPVSASGSQFSCLVSNGYGIVLSSNAILTVVIPPRDWFTELFRAQPNQPGTTNPPSILSFKTFTFTPDGSPNFYTVCSLPTLTFPTDPTGGTPLRLTGDDYFPITLSGGKTVAIYTNRSSVIYVGGSGYLTMNSGDTSHYASYASHFSLPRVSALYCWLTPGVGGPVSWKQLDDRAAVTYQAIPTLVGDPGPNSFQVELFFDGRIRITYLSIKTTAFAMVGLSAGAGQPANFVASDFTAYPLCVGQPPSIFIQPTNQTVPSGSTATFTIGVGGTPPFSYSWRLDGTPIPGATNASYTKKNVQLSESGSQFSCLVSNAYGTTNSLAATLTVFVPTSEYFTELFGTAITNLAFKTFTFTPDGSANFYSVCSRPALAFPTDPTGGTPLSLGDDDSSPVMLSGASTVAIYTNRTNVIYVGSNGYLTMNAGDTSYMPSYASHFSLPRVSALYRDLDPSSGGTVSWKQFADRIAVTYQAVPVSGSSTQTNSFQVELFFDGRIRTTYLSLNTPTGLVGLSAGAGQPANFVLSDFTAYAPCGFPPPVLLSVTSTNGTLSISWSAIAGGVYQVQNTSNLLQTDWSNLRGTLSTTNGILSVSDVMTNSQRFYRVVLLP